MVLHLAEHLDVPLRDRNAMLTAAGFAPVYQESALDAPSWRASVRRSRSSSPTTSRAPRSSSTARGNLLEANAGVAAFLD